MKKLFAIVATTLISVTHAVVVRKSLHPELVYLLAQAISEEHSGAGVFQRAGDFPTLTDPEFPIAQSAIDFYKNGPPFLNKYLPSWIVPHVQRLLALLVAAGAIVFPVFSFAPKLFKSFVEFRLGSMYRRLRAIEARLQKDAAASDVSLLETDLSGIEAS